MSKFWTFLWLFTYSVRQSQSLYQQVALWLTLCPASCYCESYNSRHVFFMTWLLAKQEERKTTALQIVKLWLPNFNPLQAWSEFLAGRITTECWRHDYWLPFCWPCRILIIHQAQLMFLTDTQMIGDSLNTVSYLSIELTQKLLHICICILASSSIWPLGMWGQDICSDQTCQLWRQYTIHQC